MTETRKKIIASALAVLIWTAAAAIAFPPAGLLGILIVAAVVTACLTLNHFYPD